MGHHEDKHGEKKDKKEEIKVEPKKPLIKSENSNQVFYFLLAGFVIAVAIYLYVR